MDTAAETRVAIDRVVVRFHGCTVWTVEAARLRELGDLIARAVASALADRLATAYVPGLPMSFDAVGLSLTVPPARADRLPESSWSADLGPDLETAVHRAVSDLSLPTSLDEPHLPSEDSASERSGDPPSADLELDRRNPFDVEASDAPAAPTPRAAATSNGEVGCRAEDGACRDDPEDGVAALDVHAADEVSVGLRKPDVVGSTDGELADRPTDALPSAAIGSVPAEGLDPRPDASHSDEVRAPASVQTELIRHPGADVAWSNPDAVVLPAPEHQPASIARPARRRPSPRVARSARSERHRLVTALPWIIQRGLELVGIADVVDGVFVEAGSDDLVPVYRWMFADLVLPAPELGWYRDPEMTLVCRVFSELDEAPDRSLVDVTCQILGERRQQITTAIASAPVTARLPALARRPHTDDLVAGLVHLGYEAISDRLYPLADGHTVESIRTEFLDMPLDATRHPKQTWTLTYGLGGRYDWYNQLSLHG